MTSRHEMEIEEIPKPEIPGVTLKKIEILAIPHPYCITSKHLEYSSGMYLDIEGAEKKGAVCDICRKSGKILKYSQHEQIKTLFIKVPQNHDLNKIDGLIKYLNEIKSLCEDLDIKGFAFPTDCK